MNTPATALIFFSGIIAFVQNAEEPFKVDALLLNVADHRQKLALPLDNLEDRNDCRVPCEAMGDFCECRLEDATVAFSSVTGNKRLPYKPPGRLPAENNFGQIDWLVSMWYLKPDASGLLESEIATEVGASITFGWNDGATCRFEESICKGERRIWGVRFNTALVLDPAQAVAEEVVFESVVTSPIAITKGRESATLRLKCTSKESCPIFITNSMKSADDSAELCDPNKCGPFEKVNHFQEYRRIASGLLSAIPERLCGKYKDLPYKFPALCVLDDRYESRRTVGDRIICPSTVLQP